MNTGIFSGLNITSVVVPKGVTTISFAAFNGCTCLKSVTLPSTVTTIGGLAFVGCSEDMQITYKGQTFIGINSLQEYLANN